ncbi:YbjQ family protein [Candidatus Babeliales bacterium]|nr:YbjQ family protein [Candidatus Babeliales bacterium]
MLRKGIFVSSLPTITPARKCTDIGLVSGSVVKTRNIFLHFFTDFRFVFGGNMRTYEDLLLESRNEAFNIMMEQAEFAKADAVLGVRIQNSSIADGASEVLVYGTAVKYD